MPENVKEIVNRKKKGEVQELHGIGVAPEYSGKGVFNRLHDLC